MNGLAYSEARYTDPTTYCPNPQLWHSCDGDSAEVEVVDLLCGFVRALQPELCVETGTAWGYTALRIGEALVKNGHGRLHTIEHDPHRASVASERCDGMPVLVIVGDSMYYEPPEGKIVGFAWLDSHAPLRVPEFRRLRPWMKQGSIVCFHDTAPGHGPGSPDTRSEIERDLGEELRLVHLTTPRGVTIGEVL